MPARTWWNPKSFKLYLNSFNQTKFNSWDDVQRTLERDLSACAQGDVSVSLYRLNELEGQPVAHFNGTCIDDQDIEVENYEFSADYLENAASGKVVEETLVSHLLKSNCLITHQPDWGSVQIQYRGPKIDREKLLRYLVSFRHHNEFHEQCVERIFSDIQRAASPEIERLRALHPPRRLGHQPVAYQHRFCPGDGPAGTSVIKIFSQYARVSSAL